ncbi:Transcriptional regulator containing GAF, AAA-type ATPase, and DNA-binding Fis domains [Chitinophaga sp. YR573]|uniref:sigma-54 interaction domain-containing protein n=1 Tax=Chitinophaga sp. YR573 TaxID=1881040 RepID=UPI0008D862A7|nr:sigma 54-interacting transcriptional regulator [Chitinophaga sp. YR573]SEW43172.1 Transcriptional regulator containing GAF, AAA-type ATPase, and DNA-binding Fis domains [Chitinophaga sp. YR573]
MKRTRIEPSGKDQTYNVNNAVTPVINRKQFMNNTKKELRRIISFDSSYIVVYSEGYIHYSCFTENMHPLVKQNLFKNTFICEGALTQSKPFIIQHHQINIFSRFPLSLLHKENGFKSACIVPLSVNNVLTGYLVMESFQENHFHSPEMFEKLADPIAMQACYILLHEKLNNELIPSSVPESYPFEEMIGKSKPLLEVFDNISMVSRTDVSVLLLGETGTGKELIAQAIHRLSSRSTKTLVKLNCAALPPQLIESELFGHEKGAFTGAIDKRIGKFEVANGSTLFLDEIGELPLELQAKLLRALQEKEIERLGSNKVIKVDVRIIAATNRELDKEVAEGRFRADLYFRLNVFPINIPPLRERKEDIPLLATHFLQQIGTKLGKVFSGISPEVLQQLSAYDWPGNIRELEHVIERNAILCKGNYIQELHLQTSSHIRSETGFSIKTWEEHEKEYILYVLAKCNGKVSGAKGAAQALGIPPTTLESKMRKLGIKRQHYPGTRD